MSSQLDLSGKSHDDGVGEGDEFLTRNHDKPRRAKRHVAETRTQEENVVPVTHTLAHSMGNMLFMVIFNAIILFFGALSRAISLMFGSTTLSIRTFFGVDDNPLLNELPTEQQQQREELAYIHGNQLQQRQQLDDLRQRVQRIEQRRKERELASNGHNKAK